MNAPTTLTRGIRWQCWRGMTDTPPVPPPPPPPPPPVPTDVSRLFRAWSTACGMTEPQWAGRLVSALYTAGKAGDIPSLKEILDRMNEPPAP